jgi:hypothetical protein
VIRIAVEITRWSFRELAGSEK